MKYIIGEMEKFNPFSLSITVESREELGDLVAAIGNLPVGTLPKPLYEALKSRYWNTSNAT